MNAITGFIQEGKVEAGTLVLGEIVRLRSGFFDVSGTGLSR